MAANFWKSSHCIKWLGARDIHTAGAAVEARLANVTALPPSPVAGAAKPREATDAAALGRRRLRTLHHHVLRCLARLGRALHFKQRVIATAATYYKRFYTVTDFSSFDPRLVVPTALYLAGKCEECGVRAEDVVANTARLESQFHVLVGLRPEHLLECEFHLLQRLDFDLIVHHPYPCLEQYAEDLQRLVRSSVSASSSLTDKELTQDGEPITAGNEEEEQDDDAAWQQVLPTAWRVVNDAYFSDAVLLYPPFAIAIAALVVATTRLGLHVEAWLKGLNVNDDALRAATALLLELYADEEREVAASKARVAPLVRALDNGICPKLGAPSAAFGEAPLTEAAINAGSGLVV